MLNESERLTHLRKDKTMAKIEWTGWHSRQACKEGWDVFDNSDYSFEIERLDDPAADPELGYDEPKFANDDEAVAFVREHARAASSLHVLAIAIHDYYQGPRPC